MPPWASSRSPRSGGEVGALPLDLIEGSLYRGGGFPPFDPATTIRALLVGAGSAGTPRTPTGTITPDATAPFRNNGRWVTRYQLGSVIRTGRDPDELVLTEPPYLVGTDTIVANLRDRIEQAHHRATRHNAPMPFDAPSVERPETVPVSDVMDVTSGRTGTWVVLRLKRDVDIIDAVDWARSVGPVTVHVDCVSYEETYDRFALWHGLGKSGVQALDELLHRIDPSSRAILRPGSRSPLSSWASSCSASRRQRPAPSGGGESEAAGQELAVDRSGTRKLSRVVGGMRCDPRGFRAGAVVGVCFVIVITSPPATRPARPSCASPRMRRDPARPPTGPGRRRSPEAGAPGGEVSGP